MRIFVLISTCTLFVQVCFCQSDDIGNLKTIVPPSPNAASLAKYSEWPVNLYTGTPSISLPLYIVKGRSTAVPITLNYHASGIKVNEVASWVGLGWSLDAGGMITRYVRGLPDEVQTSPGYFIVRQNYTNPDDLDSAPINATLNATYLKSAAIGSCDTEQDVYSLSALGKSYKLVFRGGKFVTTPFSNVSIQANFTTNTWNVTLEDGTQLVFGGTFVDMNSNSNFGTEVGSLSFPSSWHLTSMISPTGETINFTYVPVTFSHEASFSESDFVKYNTNGDILCDVVDHGGSTNTMRSQTIQSYALETIYTDLERVEFSKDARLDIDGEKKLSSIKVFSKLPGVYIDQFTFNYEYSDAAGGNSYGDDLFTLRRLKLLGVDHGLSTVTDKASWNFSYNTQPLPSRRSFAQDHWGYFNGAVNNMTLLPSVYFFPENISGDYSSSTLNTISFDISPHLPGANREPSATFMQAEMLNAITYPTGGSSTFEFEPNSIVTTEEQFENAGATASLDMSSRANPYVNNASTTFSITKPEIVTLSLGVSTNGLSDILSFGVAATIKNSSGKIIATHSWTKGIDNPTSETVRLDNIGSYILEVSSPLTKDNFQSIDDRINADASVSYSQSLGMQTVTKLVGGVRVKKITDNDGMAQMERSFIYETPLQISTVDQADYLSSVESIERDGQSSSICDFIKKIRNSSTRSPIGSGTIGYGKVTELSGLSGANGRTVHLFSSVPDEDTDLAKMFPFPPPASREPRRGLEVKKTVYTAANIPLRAERTEYVFEDNSIVTTLKTGVTKTDPSVGAQDPNDGNSIGKLFYKTYIEQIKRMTFYETAYSNGGQDSLVTTTNYFYDNPQNPMPIRTETSNSDGKTVKKITRTALEKSDISTSVGSSLTASASAAIDFMQTKNMLSSVLQSEEYVNGTLTHKTLTNYQIVNSDKVVPTDAFLQTESGPLENRIHFASDPATGNIIEQSKTNDVKRAYVWSYFNQYPVAEVLNASSSDVAYTSFETTDGGNWNVSGAANTSTYFFGNKSYVLSNGSIIKTGLSTATKYVVSWWATGSGITVNNVAVTGSTTTKNGWTYYETTVTSASTITVSGTATIDDLRLYPSGAQMTTYVYEPMKGVSTSTDANQQSAFYEYDQLLRLRSIKDDAGNLIKVIDYNYQKR